MNSNIDRSIINNSEYIISFFNAKEKEVTLLMLEKLLYFLEAIYMAITKDDYLYKEEFYAWEFGPVNKTIYTKYKEFDRQPITLDNEISINGTNKEYIEILFNIFQDYTAFDLVNLSHSKDSPWQQINEEYEGVIPKNIRIDKNKTKKWFTKIIYAEEQQ